MKNIIDAEYEKKKIWQFFFNNLLKNMMNLIFINNKFFFKDFKTRI